MEALIWKHLADSSSNRIKRACLNGQFDRFSIWESQLSRLFDGVVTVSKDDSRYACEQYQLEDVRGHVLTRVDVDYFAPPKQILADSCIIGFLGSMDWVAEGEVHLEIADSANEFADLTTSLLADMPRRRSLAVAVHERLIRHNGWKGVVDEFLHLCIQNTEHS